MKTIFKNIFYACFFALFIMSCAKNDDFTTPNIDLPCEDLTATVTMAQLYQSITDKMITYENDDILEGYIMSSDQGGNFYQNIYFVDENNTFSALFRADIQAYYASYPVGTKIYLKLKGLKVQINNEVLTFGGNTSGNFVQTLPSPTAQKHIARGCKVLTQEEINQKYHSVVTLKEAVTNKYIGKLITIKDVQFEKAFWGKTFYDENNVVSETNRATNNMIESKTDNPTSPVFFRVVSQTSGFAQQIVPAKSGTMTGIMTAFRDDRQFNPRTMVDLEGLKDEPFEGGGETEGPDDSDKPAQGDKKEGVDQNQGNFVANFGQWNNFLASTNKYGVLGIAQEAKGLGPDGKDAMSIRGKLDANSYLFTTENQTVPAGAKTISFKVKGTSAKSLSFNVYRNDGTYAAYNLATDAQIEAEETVTITKDITLKPTARTQSGNPANGQNDYIRAMVNSPDNWITITLDLTGLPYNTSKKGGVFAFKIGDKAYYNLLVSDIVFDGGETEGPETPEGDKDILADFNNWDYFIKSLKPGTPPNSVTIQSYATQAKGQAPQGKDAMSINGKPKGNDYVFTIEKQAIPEGAKAIQFQLKGTAAKSLSFNIYKNATEYTVINLATGAEASTSEKEVVSTSRTLTLENNGGKNEYTGVQIDAKEWITITIDLTSIEINRSGTGSTFALKVGKEVDYSLLLSSFTIIK